MSFLVLFFLSPLSMGMLSSAHAQATDAGGDGAVSSPSTSGEGEGVVVEVGGHIKSFLVASIPYEALEAVQPGGPTGQAAVDGRLNLEVYWGKLSLQAHHAVTPTLVPGTAGGGLGGLTSTGVGVSAPEAVDLTWNVADEGGGLAVQGRTDRLLARGTAGPVDVTLGRQPISFGTGLFFAPLDLVNPFFPTTIDQEYKPGVDAARVDVFSGLSRVTVVGAYAGDWTAEGLAVAANGQLTVGVTDLQLFLGQIRGDRVLGVGSVSSIGPVGLHGDAAVTFPAEGAAETAPFVRAVVGADGRPGEKVSLAAEVYVQTLGTTDTDDYLAQLSGERYARGELWTVGVLYGAASVSYQISPLLTTSGALIGNLTDGSVLATASGAWSVADNADVVGGLYAGLGERPELGLLSATIHSEFGLYPVAAFLQLRSYF